VGGNLLKVPTRSGTGSVVSMRIFIGECEPFIPLCLRHWKWGGKKQDAGSSDEKGAGVDEWYIYFSVEGWIVNLMDALTLEFEWGQDTQGYHHEYW
jgi:hypothetical protein